MQVLGLNGENTYIRIIQSCPRFDRFCELKRYAMVAVREIIPPEKSTCRSVMRQEIMAFITTMLRRAAIAYLKA